jgi:putative transposase
MAHTYCSSLFHCVFSTQDRRKTISTEVQDRLWAYMGGVAREHKMAALNVGGMEDHVHLLLSLPSSLSVAQAMRTIKSGSSRWLHESCGLRNFAWQEGYGAFSIGHAQKITTAKYIAQQRDHHRKRNFQEEFLAFLEKHHIDYDPRFLWN